MMSGALRALWALRAPVIITPALYYAGAHAARAPLYAPMGEILQEVAFGRDVVRCSPCVWSVVARALSGARCWRWIAPYGRNPPPAPPPDALPLRPIITPTLAPARLPPSTPAKERGNNPHAAVTTLVRVCHLFGGQTRTNFVTSALRGRAVAGVMMSGALRALRALRAPVIITPALFYAGAHAARTPLFAPMGEILQEVAFGRDVVRCSPCVWSVVARALSGARCWRWIAPYGRNPPTAPPPDALPLRPIITPTLAPARLPPSTL